MYLEWINTLKSSLLFRGIEGDSLNVMLDCLKPRIRRYRQRKIIVNYGDSFEGVGIIASGKVAVARETYSGNRIIMGLLDAGDIFGEMIAFSDNRLWQNTVISQENSCILFLPPDRITGTCSNICLSHAALIMNMLKILSNKALMLNKKIEYISAKNIRGKISSYLLDIYRQSDVPVFNIKMKRHELADYLNIPRPSLSREMALMRDEGIIAFHGPVITVNDLRKLEETLR